MDQSTTPTYTPIDINELSKKKPLKKLFILTAGLLLVLISGLAILFLSSHNQKPVKSGKKIVPTEKPASPSATIIPTGIVIQDITSTPTINATSSPTNEPTSTSTPTSIPTSAPMLTPTPADTQPPQTNIFYPQENGTIGYKINNQVCTINSAPYDDRTSSNQIETQYAFDSDQYSSYAKTLIHMCRNTLSNGPHIIKYRSRDEAGNVETEQTRHFTVAIEGN